MKVLPVPTVLCTILNYINITQRLSHGYRFGKKKSTLFSSNSHASNRTERNRAVQSNIPALVYRSMTHSETLYAVVDLLRMRKLFCLLLYLVDQQHYIACSQNPPKLRIYHGNFDMSNIQQSLKKLRYISLLASIASPLPDQPLYTLQRQKAL